MKLKIDIPDGCYEEIKEVKFPAQEVYRLINWIKEGEAIEDDLVEIQNIIPGTTIEADNIKMEILDWTYLSADEKEYGVLCLAKDILFEQPFDKGNNNNWEKSSLRRYLNREYKESLDEGLVGALIPFNRNLLTDDGMKDYGACVDLISLISCEEYREYREYISDKPDWWWTLTAWSAKPGHSNFVRFVATNGSLRNDTACNGYRGVSPLFLLKPNFKVKIVGDE